MCIIGLELVISSEDTFYASYFVEEDVQTQRLTADIMMMMEKREFYSIYLDLLFLIIFFIKKTRYALLQSVV